MTDNEIISIDEAIRHCYEVYYERDDVCKECREEHMQLAKWLKELKTIRNLINHQKIRIERLEKEYKRNAVEVLRNNSQYATAKATETAFDVLIAICDNYIQKERKNTEMTNYQKIKQMSIDEMAACSIPFFNCPYDTPYVGCDMGKKYDDDCIKCTKAWLEKEVEE